jgi:hypothetical protein
LNAGRELNFPITLIRENWSLSPFRIVDERRKDDEGEDGVKMWGE